MNSLPFSVADLVDHIKHCGWQARAYRNFGLQHTMLKDIASLARPGEEDLQSLSTMFAESAKERLSVAGGKWSWRTRDSAAGYKSPYLNWLKSQWATGRWTEDATIHANARHFLDPRWARFQTLSYQSGSNNPLGKSWPELVQGYRDIAGQEARRQSERTAFPSSKISKAGVKKYALHHFERGGWTCHSAGSQIGNILTVEQALVDSKYVFRLALSLADKGLLDHVDAWFSVTVAGADLRMVNGGPDALVGSSIDGLLLPAAGYYLEHDKDPLRIVCAIEFVDSVVQALTHLE